MNFYFVTIHYKSRISEDFGDFQYTSLLGAYLTIEAMSNELALLREQVAYLTKKLYGKSSEKRDYNQNQLSLFDDMELPEEESDCPR